MFKYIAKRIVIFIPTLFVVSVLVFMLKEATPGDPVLTYLDKENQNGVSSFREYEDLENDYRVAKKKLGLDFPVFYFSISTKAHPDTMYKVLKMEDRENLNRLVDEYGNWEKIAAYYKNLERLERQIWATKPTSAEEQGKLKKIRTYTEKLFKEYAEKDINTYFKYIDDVKTSDTILVGLNSYIADTKNAYEVLKTNQTKGKNYIPVIRFNGLKNQYHKWLTKFLALDFGISLENQQPVKDKIKAEIVWTIVLSFLAILFSYLIAVPLGVYSAVKKDSRGDNIITTFLFMLYSLPNFWVATLLIMFFGVTLEWFPTHGLGTVTDAMSWLEVANLRAYHLVLPLICWTYPTLAFLSRQMRGGMLNVLNQDYIRTAKAKGLTTKTIIWKHAFRNSLMPIITLFANVFPRLIAGSVVLEYIFNLPGLGNVLYKAIPSDYPVIFTMVMFTAILTMLGYLVADILYAIADPRVKYNK